MGQKPTKTLSKKRVIKHGRFIDGEFNEFHPSQMTSQKNNSSDTGESKEIPKLTCPAQLRHHVKRTLCGKDLTYNELLIPDIREVIESFKCDNHPDEHYFDKHKTPREFKKLKDAHERLVKFRTVEKERVEANKRVAAQLKTERAAAALEMAALPVGEPLVPMTDAQRKILRKTLPIAQMLPLRPIAQTNAQLPKTNRGGKRKKTKRKRKRKKKRKRKTKKKRKTKRKRKKQ